MQFKTRFNQVKKWVLANKIKSGVAVVALVLIIATIVGGGNGAAYNEQVVTPKQFIQRVSVSGKVTSPDDVAMAFENSGRVDRISVAVGDTVYQGQPLVSLNVGTLAADLARARADVAIKSIGVQNSEVDVDNALRTLLSDGLAAVPSSENYSLPAPIVTGAYKSTEQGTYKVIVKRVSSGSRDFEIRVFDLEQVPAVEILETSATALGTRGLYISFPADIELYNDTIWYVSVPNVKSSSYVTNYNAYQQALTDRERSLSGGTIASAELAQAQAELQRIQTEINQRTIFAPFAGVVTSLDARLGGAVSINNPVVSVISNEVLEIESYVPEINISHLAIGDLATVTLDAYGETDPFSAKVVSIDPAETVRDGVTTYRVILHFVLPDERIRSGMTANIIITTDERENVISVPQGVIQNKDGKRYVTVVVDGKEEKREVLTGAVSALGEIEILSGLSSGDTILVKAP